METTYLFSNKGIFQIYNINCNLFKYKNTMSSIIRNNDKSEQQNYIILIEKDDIEYKRQL